MSSPTVDRRSEVLDHSRALLRTRGFNAFSHRDLAALVGVKSSSVHYYFPSKEDIGLALIGDYRAEIMAFLAALEDLPVTQRLDRFTSLFAEAAASGDQWCVAGMLASDFETLGETLRAEVRQFFRDVEGWLAVQARLLRPDLKQSAAQRLGKTCMALLEGSLLLARSQGEPQRAAHAAESLKLLLGAK
jgi:TetR/AcrR family transcriptional regulator, transcriptional repressor for nem operon